MARIHVLPGVLVLVATACIETESQDQLKDLRILAIKTTPPDILYSAVHTLAANQRPPGELGPYSIKAEALVVDPLGREVSVSIRLCPDSRDDACTGYHVRSNAPNDQIAAMVPLVRSVVSTAKSDLLAAGEVPTPAAWFDLNDSAMDYMAPHDVNGRASPLAIVNPALPSFVVRANVANGAQEVAFHRFMLNADLWGASLPPPLLQSIDQRLQSLVGFPRCTPEQEAAADEQWNQEVAEAADGGTLQTSVQCVRQRRPNHNPTIERFLYFPGNPEQGPAGGRGFGPGGRKTRLFPYTANEEDPTLGGQFIDHAGPVNAAPGESFTLRAVPSSGSHEHYQRFDVDSITGKITASEHDEDLAFAWFTTAGNVSHTTSENGFVDARYTVGMDTPNGPAFVWVVVRDQRGGVDWRRMDFQVKAAPSKLAPRGGGRRPGG